MDYRFQHGQGDELKVFSFAEDGSYVSGWARAGQATHFQPDRTETDNLYERLVEVDELLPSSFVVPLTLLMCNLIIPFPATGRAQGVGLALDVDSPSVSAECSANADLSEDLTIIALDVNCSDDDLERDIEDVFDELIVDALDTVQDESLEDALVRSNLGCIVKTIDSMLTYKKLEKFIQ